MSLEAKKYLHQAYTKRVEEGDGEGEYLGRTRVTSTTDSFNGKVYMPQVLEHKQEATVIDFDKDPVLKKYVEDVENLFLNEIQKHPIAFDDFLELLSKKISKDFPYSMQMRDKKFHNLHYPSGKKYYLGHMMRNQNMVCRHMALLVAAVMDHLTKSPKIKNHIDPTLEVRFLSDQQTEEGNKNDRSGHAYALVKKFSRSQQKYVYMIVDPTVPASIEAPEILKSKVDESTKYRYLFSLMRHLIVDTPPAEDRNIVELMNEFKKDNMFNALLENLTKLLKKDYPAELNRLLRLMTSSNIHSALHNIRFM